MNYYIQQSIQIQYIKIGAITNSSVLQIGSAGVIKPASYLYNTGGFTQPAPVAGAVPFQPIVPPTIEAAPAVPLHAPVR